MRTLDTTLFSGHCALTQPEQSFLEFCDSYCILAAGILATLEMLEAFYDHVNKVFIVYTIHAALFDGTLLKMNGTNQFVIL